MLPYSHHWVVLLFKGSKPKSASLCCPLTYFLSAILGCQCHVCHHISCIGPLLVLVWEGLHWLLAGGCYPYRRQHIALRAGLEPHHSPISVFYRSPCARCREVKLVKDTQRDVPSTGQRMCQVAEARWLHGWFCRKDGQISGLSMSPSEAGSRPKGANSQNTM